ncbi:MAG: UDP-3-O-(3-hydroxymyristoyl)glucosamine N-acyltransferase [Bdellovibrionales bacterium CG10_big_fil_rev_8_21_14_0_10_45_34]|nr:MAG: UDP-3-O-(3-hydroxymyristoyl)glucosamine N-acyltransferase [Bdellovibrionales bacterium CG10_big_fil_rev_8_21_14_0_10_45_34]
MIQIPFSVILESTPDATPFKRIPDFLVEDVTPIEEQRPFTISYAAQPKMLSQLQLKAPAALLVNDKLAQAAHPLVEDKNIAIVVCANPTLTAAKIIERFFTTEPWSQWPRQTDPSAVIGVDCLVDPTAFVGPNATLGKHVKVGKHAVIGANVVLEDGVCVGDNTVIHSGAIIQFGTRVGSFCEIGPNTTIGSRGFGLTTDSSGRHHSIPQRGYVIIEDEVEIGANCTIDRATFGATVIGKGAKLDNLIHIAHNCSVGEGSVLTAGFMMAGSSTLGKYVLAAGRASVSDHVHVADRVQLGGMAGVSKDVQEAGAYAGYPLQSLQKHLRILSALSRLPDMVNDIRRLKKLLK